jgi:hypothetical protein
MLINKFVIGHLALLLSLLLVPLTAPQATQKATGQQSVARQQFQRGKQLIENNCIDCMGGTQSGVEKGIKEIQAAVDAGYPDQKAAYKLLEEAYAYMTTYTDKHPDVEALYAAKRLEVTRKLFERYPNDPEVLELYVNTVKDEDEQIAILRKLLKLSPHQPDASFLLSLLLLKKDKFNQVLPFMKDARNKQEDPEAVLNYVERWCEELSELGCELPEQGQWRQKVSEAFDKATMGAGDANAMPEFKNGFLAALSKHDCPSSSAR